MGLAQHIEHEASRVDHNPTEAQKIAGNYRKGHIKVHGLDITIENPKGSTRRGTSPGGKKWSSVLPNYYGYIRRTEGADGDHVDVYVGPHLKSPHVFVIDQHDPDRGHWDEHKVFVGFSSRAHAVAAYKRAFSDGKGAQRIGHVEAMTIDQLKEWLAGDTTSPVKHRAAGGRAGYADGGGPYSGANLGPLAPTGDPTFDPAKPFTDADSGAAPAFDPSKPFTPVEDAGGLDAALHGAGQGLTFGLSDEIMGARAAAPKIPFTDRDLPDEFGIRTMAGAARTGLGYATGLDPEGIKNYENARDAERRAIAAAKQTHPYIYAGSEMAGAIPAMAAMPEAGFLKAAGPAASRIAQFGRGALASAITGGEYGAATGIGEGESPGERAMNAATGLVSGIVGGGAAHTVGSGLSALGQKYIAPIGRTVLGWMDPKGEAARRLVTALRGDSDMIAAGTAKGMTPQQWVQARQNGEPVTLADLGAGRTQALLRSAANTSPEARAQLEKFLEERFHDQSTRIGNTVRNALPGGTADATKTGDQLVAQYDQGRVPAYKSAYVAGDKPIMSPVMERMMSSDTFVSAMKRAISSGKDRDVAQGLGGFNPMVNVTPDGRIVFNKGAQGAPTYPNLQYWDQVKRELDSVASQARRSGDTANVAGDLAKLLRGELDKQVPEYAGARGVAEKYFGESNALEAGQKLAGKKMNPVDVEKILREMKPDERALFREGYASDLANRVIGNSKDTTNLTKGNGVFQSPNERRMGKAIFGVGGMAQIEARMHLETIMDGARQALGNSTTARQLIEAGLAGGAVGGYLSGWDPKTMGEGFLGGAGARVGAAHLLKDEVAAGARKLIGKVDARTARHVAELLTSDNPADLRAGYQLAAKNQNIMDGLRNIARRVSLAVQSPARVALPYHGAHLGSLQGTVPASADQKQQ